MTDRSEDFRDCATAYDCRDRLPELSRWLTDEEMKLIPIWSEARFEKGRTYFDLTNPERGPFVATGDEGPITNHTYTYRDPMPESVWAKLTTWQNPVTPRQGEAIDMTVEAFRIGKESSAAGDARPLPQEDSPGL